MAAFTSTPTPAGDGPSLLGIAKSIGTKIRDAAESAKEEKEKAVEAGESPKKGSLFKSALANQFNPVKSKKAKGNWNKQFSWNKKSDKPESVNGKPTGGAGAGTGTGATSEKLKNFIAGGFSAILADTTQMVSKLSSINSATTENLGATSRSSATLVAIKETVDTQTEIKRKQLEDQQRANAESKLEQTKQVGRTFKPKQSTEGDDADGSEDGGGGGGMGPLDWLLGGLDLADTVMSIRALMGGAKAAGGTAAGGGAAGGAAAGGGAAGGATGIGAGAAAAVVGGAGLAASGLGEGFFQLTKKGGFGEQTRDFLKAKGSEVGGLQGMLLGGLGNMAGFSNEATKGTGLALDAIGAPFRYAIEAIRNPFLSEEDKKKQAENLAKFDARIREQSRAWMNRVDFMNVVPDQKGGFGNIYGDDRAQSQMMGKMSEGGMIKLNAGASIVDNPTKTLLNPGDSVIPLNRNVGKQMLGDVKNIDGMDDVTAAPFKAVGATLLGVSVRMLKATDSGIAGDAVRQEISSLSRTFGVSNLSTTTSLGRAEFPKQQSDKKAKEFLMDVFDGMNISGGKGTEKKGKNKTTPNAGDVAGQAQSMVGNSAQQAAEYMDTMDEKLTSAGVPDAIFGSDKVKGDVIDAAWCASYVAALLGDKGYKPPNSAMANAYAPGKWGDTIDAGEAKPGDIITFDYSGKKSFADHVAIVTGNDGKTITYVGGNQGSTGNSRTNKVTEGSISVNDKTVLGITRPKEKLSSNNNPDAKQTAQATAGLSAPAIASASEASLPNAQVSQLAQDGGFFETIKSWFGLAQDRDMRVSSKTNMGKTVSRLQLNRMLMEGDLEGYERARKEMGMQGGGVKRANYTQMQKAARIKAQQASVNALNSGKGLDLKGATLGTNIGKGYGAVYKGREAIKVKLPPGGSYEPEITVGGKRFFAVKQGGSVIYVSNFKANQKNLGVGTPPAKPKPAKSPTPASRPGSSGSSGSSGKPSTAVVNNVVASPVSSSSSSSTTTAPGGPVAAGRTRPMSFADFLYEDLV